MYPIWVQDVVQAMHESPPPQPTDDRITMLLTALGVGIAAATLALAIVAIYLAYLAVIGKREIIEKAEAAAREAALRYLEANDRVRELNQPAVDAEPGNDAQEGQHGD